MPFYVWQNKKVDNFTYELAYKRIMSTLDNKSEGFGLIGKISWELFIGTGRREEITYNLKALSLLGGFQKEVVHRYCILGGNEVQPYLTALFKISYQ